MIFNRRRSSGLLTGATEMQDAEALKKTLGDIEADIRKIERALKRARAAFDSIAKGMGISASPFERDGESGSENPFAADYTEGAGVRLEPSGEMRALALSIDRELAGLYRSGRSELRRTMGQ